MATTLRKKEIMEDIAKRMWLGLQDVISEYEPKVVVLGGPMGKIFKRYSKYIPTVKGVKYVRPRRPLESVVYGGYLYGKSQLDDTDKVSIKKAIKKGGKKLLKKNKA
jgi:hypothetical protein